MLILYKNLLNLAYVLIWPFMAYKRLRGRNEWSQRRVLKPARYLPSIQVSNGRQPEAAPCLWGHASSMGEVRVLARLFAALRKLKPDIRYCISTYTRTGQKLARELFGDAEAVFYFPLDCRFPLKRLFGQFRPDGIVMVETEIWPYFLDFCRRLDIPLFLANGRLSDKSAGRYRKFRRALEPLLATYRKFAMQTEADAARMVSIGADRTRTIILGNIKNDPDPDVDFTAMRKKARERLDLPEERLLLIAASTRPGEEEILCRAIRQIPDFEKGVSLLLAPRHLERLEDVKTILDMNQFRFGLFGDLETGEKKSTPVILMDKMGLLAELFYGADLAFVGGTLADLGGHNLMEPVLAGTPVVFGPSTYNVAEAAEKIITRNLGMMVKNETELTAAIRRFTSGSLEFHRIHPGNSTARDLSVTGKTAALIAEELGL